MTTPHARPHPKAIQTYYDELRRYADRDVTHETAVRSAFQNLLAETARPHRWSLVPELSMKVKGRVIRPDGTLRDDEWMLPRGFWEAKDTYDSLDDEIRKKVATGYPLLNTIFEDTRHGVLFQNGQEVFRADLTVGNDLAILLGHFYSHT